MASPVSHSVIRVCSPSSALQWKGITVRRGSVPQAFGQTAAGPLPSEVRQAWQGPTSICRSPSSLPRPLERGFAYALGPTGFQPPHSPSQAAPSACLTTVPAPVSLESSFLCSSTGLLPLLSFLQAALLNHSSPHRASAGYSLLGLLCLQGRGPGLH